MAEALVTDLPLWTDCPFKEKIPAGIEIRKGKLGEQEIESLWWSERQVHICCPEGRMEAALKPALSNLAGIAFEQDFPNVFISMIRAEANTIETGADFPLEYRKALARFIEIEAAVTGYDTSAHKNFLSSLPVLH